MSKKNNSAKFAFFYILSLASLFFVALSSGMIIFQVINKSIVDILREYSGRYSSSQLKFAISAIIVSTPIFYITIRQIQKSLFSGELKSDSGIRKWLTYFVLLVSSMIMTGWSIGIINSFLEGELTLKFILKAITAIGIATAIFTFYFYDIRRDNVSGKRDKIVRTYGYTSLFMIIVIFVLGIFFVESPKEARDRRIDGKILQNFNKIDNTVFTFYGDHKKLPENLNELIADSSVLSGKDIKNIVTNNVFDYNIKKYDTYELCTVFLTSNKDEEGGFNGHRSHWQHESGYQCLKQKVRVQKVEPIIID